MTAKTFARKLAWRMLCVAAVVAWYLSLSWMLRSDPSALTFGALLPMLTFCTVASVTITYVIVALVDKAARR